MPWNHLLIGFISGLFTFIFSLFPIAELLELKGYDLFYLFKKEAHIEDIVIVAIDEPSFAEIGKQWPWPRSLHARLIDTLKKEGASVIGLDIIFAEPSRTEEDKALSEAIRQAGNVVLASDVKIITERRYAQEMVIEPIPILKRETITGLVIIPLDMDNVVRRFYPVREGERLFAEQIAYVHTRKKYKLREEAYIHYIGPPRSFTTVSYYQAIEPFAFLPKNFFKDKIVLVGMATKSTPEPERPLPEMFATPFIFSKKSGLMFGVEVHANMVNDIIRGEFVVRMSLTGRCLLFLTIGLIGSFLQIRWRPVMSGLLTFTFLACYLVATYYIFLKFLFWIPTLSVIVSASMPYGIFGIRSYIHSEKKRREIKRAFSHYLSPSILEYILAHPEDLKLGGEKVEATILFSDIDSFTTMAEKISPEEVASLLNRYFGEMTRIIFEHKGTVDKFIGDGIMAFWGAPVPDADHALNACRAAIAMQERLKSLKKELRERGLPEISIRIGIHTGLVIVGNMGSSELFDYTVLGDAVNLASRLEAANKDFGTSIIISEAVYRKVADTITAHPLGRTKVKGKIEEVEIYELITLLSA